MKVEVADGKSGGTTEIPEAPEVVNANGGGGGATVLTEIRTDAEVLPSCCVLFR